MSATDRKPSKHQRRLLEPFAQSWSDLVSRAEAMSDADLAEFLAAAEACSTTNCGWSEYEIAKALAPFVRSEIFRRGKKAQESSPQAIAEARREMPGG